MHESDPLPPAALRSRLREKLPEILIEAGSIVLALLLALGFGAWHERRQQHDLARQARAAVVSEIRENLAELGHLRANVHANMDALEAAAATPQPDQPGDSLPLDMRLALLSEAAWRATLASGAMQHIDFAWSTRVGKVYELQELVGHAQSLALDQVTEVTNATTESRRVLAQRLLGRQRALSQLADDLDAAYHDLVDGTR